MKIPITLTICFIAMGTAIFFWNKYTPYTPPKTPEQMRMDAYYHCTLIQTTNGRPIINCNDIK